MDEESNKLAPWQVEVERRLAIVEMTLFGHSTNQWHETGLLGDGRPWGKLGALVYLIDGETKRPISKGYHEIIPVFNQSVYRGKAGAHEEEFRIEWEMPLDAPRSPGRTLSFDELRSAPVVCEGLEVVLDPESQAHYKEGVWRITRAVPGWKLVALFLRDKLGSGPSYLGESGFLRWSTGMNTSIERAVWCYNWNGKELQDVIRREEGWTFLLTTEGA